MAYSNIYNLDLILGHIQHTMIIYTDSPHIFFTILEFFTPAKVGVLPKGFQSMLPL